MTLHSTRKFNYNSPFGQNKRGSRDNKVLRWWVRTTEFWDYQDLLGWFLNACWEPNPAAGFAAGLLNKAKKNQKPSTPSLHPGFESGFVAAA